MLPTLSQPPEYDSNQSSYFKCMQSNQIILIIMYIYNTLHINI